MYIAKLIFAVCAAVAVAADQESNREPKVYTQNFGLFAVTTTTSISSLSTQTLCYSFSDATKPLSACAAKRRSNKSPIGSAEGKAVIDEELLISPSQTDAGKDIDSGMILDSSKEEMVRNGKFISYWITTTLTSTSTIYTATGTLGGIQCTPNGFTYANCPGNG